MHTCGYDFIYFFGPCILFKMSYNNLVESFVCVSHSNFRSFFPISAADVVPFSYDLNKICKTLATL